MHACMHDECARRSFAGDGDDDDDDDDDDEDGVDVDVDVDARSVGIGRRARGRGAFGVRRAGTRRRAADDGDAPTKAPLPRDYAHHTPGSVQETDDVVVFAHERPEEADKWKDTVIVHVGEGSRERVRLGVCIGEFHNKLMDRMLEDARVSAEAMGSTIDKVVWVPGTYEAPLVVENMLQDPTLDACVVIGYIEKGSTLHGQEMGATFSIIGKQLELEYGKPVGMGIIGPGATAEQADQRVAYAGNAVRAAIAWRAPSFRPKSREPLVRYRCSYVF